MIFKNDKIAHRISYTRYYRHEVKRLLVSSSYNFLFAKIEKVVIPSLTNPQTKLSFYVIYPRLQEGLRSEPIYKSQTLTTLHPRTIIYNPLPSPLRVTFEIWKD